MRRISPLGTVAAALLVTANLGAQAPNFAGKWVRADDPAAAGGGGGRGGGRGGGGGAGFACGAECTITQDAKTLTITRSIPGREGGPATEVKTVLMLDGSDSKNMMAGRGGEQMTVVSKAKWDGTKLVVSTTRDMGGNSVTTTQTVSLEGGNLVVESTGPGREGTPTTTKTTYKKG